MANTTISPNMNLIIPSVSVDPGPDWANNLNSSLSIVDQHNHSPGSGVQITQNGISLSAGGAPFDSLSFNATNAYSLRSVRFSAQAAALSLATDVGCLYESGVDLYYNDGSGNQVRLTSGGSIIGTAGSITGLPSGTASASYSGGTFVWQSATVTAANMDAASYIFRNATANSKGLTLNPPNAMAADYSLTLPAVPGATSLMTLDTSGNMSATIALGGGGLLGSTITNNTITATQIANNTISDAQIVPGGITGNSIANSSIGIQLMGTVFYIESISSGGASTTSASYVDVTNLSVSLTTNGRPVFMGLSPDGSSSSNVGIQATSPGDIDGDICLNVDGQLYEFRIRTGQETNTFVQFPTGGFSCTKNVSAGAHVFKAQYKINTGNGNIQVNNCKLTVYEMY